MSEHDWQDWLDDADPDFSLSYLRYQQTGDDFYGVAVPPPADTEE